MSPSAEFDDYRAFVNPVVVDRAELAGEPYRIVAARGDRLVADDGRECVDFLAGWGTQAFGHRPAAVESAIRAFLDGAAPSFFPSNVSPYAGRLGRALAERTGYDASYFASGGTEVVEAALKLARAATGRPRLLGLDGAYHGCTMGSVALMHPGPYRDPFGPHVPAIDRVPFGDVAALRAALALPDVAAIVVEPIQVEAGVRTLPPEYVEVLCRETLERGVLLVADEIQTGFGRTGAFLATERWPRRPDVVLLAKAFGGGVVAHSALLTRRGVFDRAYGTFEAAEAHASTFSGNALACVASLAALDLVDDALLERVARRGAVLRGELENHRNGLVADIRGHGLLLGIELRQPDHPYYRFEYLGAPELDHRPAIGLMAVRRMYRSGFLCHVCAHDWRVVRIHPPFITDEAVLERFARAFGETLDDLESLA